MTHFEKVGICFKNIIIIFTYWIYGDEEHGISGLNSYTHDLINILSNRSNNGKINESIKIVCSSLAKVISDGMHERIIVWKINAISGWCIETFYLGSKITNFGSSTIHLVGVDTIEIANSI